MILPGVIASGSSGGGGYTAKAVHFDGATWLSTASLTTLDTQFIFESRWFKLSSETSGFGSYWAVDPGNTGTSNSFYSLSGEARRYVVNANSVDNSGSIQLYDIAAADQWINVLASINTDADTYQVYINDVLSDKFPIVDMGTPYIMIFNGLPFWFGSDSFSGDELIADIADVFIAPGLNVDLSIEANRRLFIDANGKPVDPATAVAALGTPAVLFSGDASTFGTNQGNGGIFTTTGALTNASTSPSG